MKVLSYTFKGHIDNSSTKHHLIVHNATIEMHGKYKCSIRTDLGSDENEQSVVVITQPACRLSDWRIRSDPSQCRETLLLDCRNMFPRPAPSCGLWNGKLERFVMGLSVDISEEDGASLSTSSPSSSTSAAAAKRQQTFRVRYVQQFDLLPWPQQQQQQSPGSARLSGAAANASQQQQQQQSSKSPISPAYLLQFAGHLWFKCDIAVPETSWRLSLAHKLFDYSDACLQDPLEAIASWRHSYVQQLQQQQATNSISSKLQEHNVAGPVLLPGQPEDFELTAANLRYELLPAGSDKRGARVELSCWRKPRIGTLAKLSCQNKFQPELPSRVAGAGLSAQVRLRGASLLQCGESGWFPVRSSASLSRLTANSRPLGAVAGGGDVKIRAKKQRSPMQSGAANTSQAAEDDDGGDRGDDEEEGKIPQRIGSPTTMREQVTYIQAMHSNDLDDGAGELVRISQQAPPAPKPGHDSDDDDDGREDHQAHERDDRNRDRDESLDIIPGAGAEQGGRRTKGAAPLSSMDPAELAALLPTCVAPTRPRQQHPNQHQLQLKQAADLQDGPRPIPMLDSSAKSRNRPTEAAHGGEGFAFADLGSIFNFSSSSAAASNYRLGSATSAPASLCLCLCLLAAALSFILTGSRSNIELKLKPPSLANPGRLDCGG